MKLRTLLLIGFVSLVAGMLVATVLSVTVALQNAARRDVADDLARGLEAFALIKAQRDALHRAEGRVVAEEPRLKAVVATEDISHETIFGVAYELHKALQSDLFLITDGEGILLADVLEPEAEGFDLKGMPAVAGALREGDASGTWTSEGRVFEVQARRLSFGTSPVGVLVIGHELGDAVARRVGRQMGGDVVVQYNGRAIAALIEDVSVGRDELSAALAAIPTDPDGPATEIVLGGARYMALAATFPGYSGSEAIRYVILRSLDHALAPAARVSQIVYGVATLALIAVAVLAFTLSRRLTRPLDALVALTREIAAGNLGARAAPVGPIEVQELGGALNLMAGEIAESHAQLVAKERLVQEHEIGARIQTSILPRIFDIDGLEIAATMIPAAEVGGDYYDVLPVRGSTWIGIGDVAGHGVVGGLVMLMTQSVISALTRESPLAPPSAVLRVLNSVLYDNIRRRLGNDEHVTLTLFRYRRDGLVTFAGAHEEIVLCRAETGRCELIRTPGPWLGAVEDISEVTVDTELRLQDGDVMVLYTDGITEARSGAGELFGIEPVMTLVEALVHEPVEQIRDAILAEVARWAAVQEDDISVMVLRYNGPSRRIA